MPKNRLLRYLIVGTIAFIIEISSLYFLHHNLKLSPVKSVAISFWIGFVSAFVLQKWVTFQNLERRPAIIANQLAFYSLLVLWNYIFTLVLVKLLDHSLSVYICRAFAILVTTSWNYVIYRSLFKTMEDGH